MTFPTETVRLTRDQVDVLLGRVELDYVPEWVRRVRPVYANVVEVDAVEESTPHVEGWLARALAEAEADPTPVPDWVKAGKTKPPKGGRRDKPAAYRVVASPWVRRWGGRGYGLDIVGVGATQSWTRSLDEVVHMVRDYLDCMGHAGAYAATVAVELGEPDPGDPGPNWVGR